MVEEVDVGLDIRGFLLFPEPRGLDGAEKVGRPPPTWNAGLRPPDVRIISPSAAQIHKGKVPNSRLVRLEQPFDYTSLPV